MIARTGNPPGHEGGAGEGMQKRIATTLALALCALAVVVPITAALYMAHRQSMDEATEQAIRLATEIAQRTDMAGEQAGAAYERLRQIGASGSYSNAMREQMREIAMDYRNVQAVGRLSGNRIVCSAQGPRADGVDLGAPSYVSPGGTRVYLSAAIGGRRRFVVTAMGNAAVAIHPEALLDMPTGAPGLSLGVFGRSSRQLWTHRGAFDPAWMTALSNQAPQAVVFDGKHLVAIQASKKFDLAAYAAIPLADLKSRLRGLVIILLPIGLALGLAMAATIVFLARQRPHGRCRSLAALAAQQAARHAPGAVRPGRRGVWSDPAFYRVRPGPGGRRWAALLS